MFHGQLCARSVPDAAVPLVGASPVGAPGWTGPQRHQGLRANDWLHSERTARAARSSSSATACCAARLTTSSGGTASNASASRGRASVLPARACHTDDATEASGMPRVRASLSDQPACSYAEWNAPSVFLRLVSSTLAQVALARAGKTRGRTAARTARRGRSPALMDSWCEENKRIISPAMPSTSKPQPSSRMTHSRPKRRVITSSKCAHWWRAVRRPANGCRSPQPSGRCPEASPGARRREPYGSPNSRSYGSRSTTWPRLRRAP
jgi:hypothetical protein